MKRFYHRLLMLYFAATQPIGSRLRRRRRTKSFAIPPMHLAWVALLFVLLLIPVSAFASVTGTDFQDLYDFFYEAATGYLGRAIALVGGLMGLGVGAATGKPIPALMGVVLAIFGTMGPTLVNNLFNSATI